MAFAGPLQASDVAAKIPEFFSRYGSNVGGLTPASLTAMINSGPLGPNQAFAEMAKYGDPGTPNGNPGSVLNFGPVGNAMLIAAGSALGGEALLGDAAAAPVEDGVLSSSGFDFLPANDALVAGDGTLAGAAGLGGTTADVGALGDLGTAAGIDAGVSGVAPAVADAGSAGVADLAGDAGNSVLNGVTNSIDSGAGSGVTTADTVGGGQAITPAAQDTGAASSNLASNVAQKIQAVTPTSAPAAGTDGLIMDGTGSTPLTTGSAASLPANGTGLLNTATGTYTPTNTFSNLMDWAQNNPRLTSGIAQAAGGVGKAIVDRGTAEEAAQLALQNKMSLAQWQAQFGSANKSGALPISAGSPNTALLRSDGTPVYDPKTGKLLRPTGLLHSGAQ